MGLVGKGPKLFTCPRCRKAYLGHDPLPDCPSCGDDYRVKVELPAECTRKDFDVPASAARKGPAVAP